MFEGAEGTKACEALGKALAAKSSPLLKLHLASALYCRCTCDSMRVCMCICLHMCVGVYVCVFACGRGWVSEMCVG